MQGLKYCVDIVMCVDVTGSMQGLIDKVKNNALKLYDDLEAAMKERDRYIDELRVRVIGFRDYYADGSDTIIESTFFQLPQERDAFAKFVTSLKAKGGGDEPENGLEALTLAMKSSWTKSGDRRRHVIVLWTDASSHPLEKQQGGKPSSYPKEMPKNFSELTAMWDGQEVMDASAKRLVLFAPDAYAWTDIANYWTLAIHHSSKAGEGLDDVDYQTILDALARSV